MTAGFFLSLALSLLSSLLIQASQSNCDKKPKKRTLGCLCVFGRFFSDFPTGREEEERPSGLLFLGGREGGRRGLNEDELHRPSPIPGSPWMLFQLPSSVPPVTPGCCEPNPLLSSAARRGVCRLWWGVQPAVRVPGQGSGSSLSQTMKHKPGSQGGEGGRAERMCPPGNRRAVFFICRRRR